MKKKILSVCLAVALLSSTILGTVAAVDVEVFKDVKQTDWYYEYVDYVSEKEYMVGISGDLFAPEENMTRAMFVTVLARLEDAKPSKDAPTFLDVPEDTWYTDAVKWAAEHEIINGIGGNLFNPEASITREQMCVIMDRYITYYEKTYNKTHEKAGSNETFPDAADVSDYAVTAVKNCRAWGLIEGNDKGYFKPLDTSTRAEVAAVISRLSWMVKGGGGGSSGGGSGDQPTPTPTPTPTPSTEPSESPVTYLVKADLVTKSDATDNKTLNLLASYSMESAEDDVTLEQIATDMISGENKTALFNAIDFALGKVLAKDRTTTQTVNDQTVEITVTKAGVISMKVAVNLATLNSDNGNSRTTVSQADLENLVEKLQKGGNVTLTETDVAALDKLIEKANEVVNVWTDEEIKTKLNEYVAGNAALEQAVEGMTPTAIKTAVGDYQTELLKIQKVVNNTPAGQPVVLPEQKPVMVMTDVNLGAYYRKAVTKYEDPETLDKAISKVEEKLGVTLNEAEREKVEALYAVNSPDKFVTNPGNGTLKIKDAADYTSLVESNVNGAVAFWKVLDKDADFYQSYLDRLDNKNTEGYKVEYTYDDSLASFLADKDGVLYGKESVTLATATVTLDDDSYSAMAQKLVELLTNMGRGNVADLIPVNGLPDALNVLIGDYTVTVSIEKK